MKKYTIKNICTCMSAMTAALILSGCTFPRLTDGGTDKEANGSEFVTAAEEKTPEEIDAEYLSYLAPADDEVDFMFANDYESSDIIKFYYGRDASAYDEILGIDRQITVDDIKEVVSQNNKISQEYKDFIIQYAEDWLTLYPGSDLRVFYHNLKTLSIEVVSEEEMMWETVSLDSAACYLRQENRILLLEGTDFSRESDNYIILTHELTHCARSTDFEDAEGNDKNIGYYDFYKMGTYAEEGIITNIAYELQGLDKRADFYPFQSSCYRIIMDCTGYDGEDFMNHSVNYLIKMMDDYMGGEQRAYKIVALIDSISSQKYTPYQEVDYTDYQELYDYITEMHMKKYLSAGMSPEQAEQVYSDFIENITHYFDKMKRPYDITADNFRTAFEKCCDNLGIS